MINENNLIEKKKIVRGRRIEPELTPHYCGTTITLGNHLQLYLWA